MDLITANRNYSSWSLRGWLMLRSFELPFNETRLQLFTDEFYRALKPYTPAGKVPVLIDGERQVWDSLAICEYVNEQHLAGRGWPADAGVRAHARAIVCEMHAGFMALRNALPMNCRARRQVELTPAVVKDIERIDAIWSGLREQYADGGPWLFGDWSIADLYYAPVALRFNTYVAAQSLLSASSREYMQRVLAHPAVVEWVAEACAESEVVDEDEAGTDLV